MNNSGDPGSRDPMQSAACGGANGKVTTTDEA